MTIRLSAMFEEHMGRILYNWKMARRRSTTQLKRNLKRSRRKKLKTESFKESATESSAPEDKIPLNVIRNAKKTNGHISDFQLSEEKRTSSASQSSSGSSTSSSSSSSVHSRYKPSVATTSRTEIPPKRKMVRNCSRKTIEHKKSESSDNSNSDDSDVPKRPSVKRKNITRRSRCKSSESEEIRTSLRRRSHKRPKYVEDSDSEPLSNLIHQRNGNDSDDSDDNNVLGTPVSSRGRVLRLTARAKAFLKR